MQARYPHGSKGTAHVWASQYLRGRELQKGYESVPPTVDKV